MRKVKRAIEKVDNCSSCDPHDGYGQKEIP